MRWGREGKLLRGSQLRYGWQLLAFLAVYFISARIGLGLSAFAKGNATLVWPPSGLSLAVLLLFGVRLWPAVALGAFLVTAGTGVPAAVALGVAVGNTLEAVLGTRWLLHSSGFRHSLDDPPSVIRLILYAAAGSTLISAVIGAMSLWLGGVIPAAAFLSVGSVWWVGDMLSDLVLAPLLLTWFMHRRLSTRLSRWAEAGALGAFLLAASAFMLADPLSLGLGRYSLAFIVFPGIIWGALRFGQRGVTLATVLVSTTALLSVAMEQALLAQLREHLLLLQVFVGVLAATGLILGASVAARDRAEAERTRLVDQLREAVRARDEFLSVASHELKTPLTALSLQVDAFLRALHRVAPSFISEAQYKRLVERVSQQIGRLSRLIEMLLDVSRIATGRLALEPAPVDLAELAREVVENHQYELDCIHSPVSLETEEGLIGVWDKLRLEQVLTNLLTNAMKFGAGKPIEVSVHRADGQAQVQVRDFGIGINPEDQARIFERFERAVSARSFGGIGLGLYISRQIIEEHGGSIRVESVPGEGSTFTVTLPMRAALEAPPMVSARRQEAAQPEAPQR